MRRLFITAALVGVVAVSAGAYHRLRGGGQDVQFATAPVTRGDVVQTVAATGTLEAVTTVQVGTQVSGTVKELGADFNSIVHKGEVIARLDPSLIQTEIEQARANLLKARSDVEAAKVAVDDAKTKLDRAKALAAKNLIPQSDLDAAEVALRAAQAQLQANQSQVVQAQATLNQNQVDLEHTVIAAPINGIVVSRNVDVGQTVAASFQSPTLFVIADDLTKMQVNASIDEADIGQIKPGETARFRVDAYPAEQFTGTVSQVRLQPATVQNVVTYSTIITVPNPDLKLKPGMTANVSVEIARRTNVLRVAAAALHFKPTDDLFAALHEPVPAGAHRVAGGAGARPANASQAWSPGSGVPGSSSGSRPGVGADRPSHQAQLGMLFGGTAASATPGRVWVFEGNQLKPVDVRLGISDGQDTELVAGKLDDGTKVVTSALTGASVAQTTRSASPLMGPQRPGMPARNVGR
jgi:HlyD family secretion protein